MRSICLSIVKKHEETLHIKDQREYQNAQIDFDGLVNIWIGTNRQCPIINEEEILDSEGQDLQNEDLKVVSKKVIEKLLTW